jgi:hypothetical protein
VTRALTKCLQLFEQHVVLLVGEAALLAAVVLGICTAVHDNNCRVSENVQNIWLSSHIMLLYLTL